MVNILGGHVGRLYDGYPHVFARDPRLKVHLYGKDVKPAHYLYTEDFLAALDKNLRARLG